MDNTDDSMHREGNWNCEIIIYIYIELQHQPTTNKNETTKQFDFPLLLV